MATATEPLGPAPTSSTHWLSMVSSRATAGPTGAPTWTTIGAGKTGFRVDGGRVRIDDRADDLRAAGRGGRRGRRAAATAPASTAAAARGGASATPAATRAALGHGGCSDGQCSRKGERQYRSSPEPDLHRVLLRGGPDRREPWQDSRGTGVDPAMGPWS